MSRRKHRDGSFTSTSDVRNVNVPKVDVLVVGAGPSGLMAAILLAEYGIDFRIVDKRPRSTPSPGLTESIQPRTLEVLECLNLRGKVERVGTKLREYAIYHQSSEKTNGEVSVHGTKRVRVGLDVTVPTSYPWSISIDKGKLVEILEEDLRDRGHEVHTGIEVTRILNQKNDPYSFRIFAIDHGAGTEDHRFSTSFTLGGDGPHQSIRENAGIPTKGFATHQWGVADFVLGESDFPDLRRRCTIRAATGNFMLIPLKPKTVRIRTILAKQDILPILPMDPGKTWLDQTGQPMDDDASVSLPDLMSGELGLNRSFLSWVIRDRLRWTLLPYQAEVKSVSYLRAHSLCTSLAESFSNASLSIFLLGSACHIHSPLTKQSINGGMMDAWNLVWKLALVLKGLADRSVLASYDVERRNILQKAMQFDAKVDELFSRIDDEAADYVGMHDFEEASGYTSGCGLRYPPNVFVKEEVRTYIRNVPYAIGPGKRIPPARIIRHVDGIEGDLWTFMPVSLHFRLLVFVGTIIETPIVYGLCRYLQSPQTPFFQTQMTNGAQTRLVDLFIIHSMDHMAVEVKNMREPIPSFADNVFEDPSGVWHTALGFSPKLGSMCLVRPDGYIALVSNLDDLGGVTAFLQSMQVQDQTQPLRT